MKQIIEEVLQAEEGVNARLKEAREKAAALKAAADRESLAQISQAKIQARDLMQETIEAAKKEAEQIRIQKLSEAEQEKETLLAAMAERVNKLVDAVCRLVLSTEGSGNSQP